MYFQFGVRFGVFGLLFAVVVVVFVVDGTIEPVLVAQQSQIMKKEIRQQHKQYGKQQQPGMARCQTFTILRARHPMSESVDDDS